ncbi:MAG: serine/threonine-protein kinase [Pseudomonadota bacterium]
MTTDSVLFQRAKAILLDLYDVSEAALERTAVDACNGDSQLEAEVVSLLAGINTSDSVVEGSVLSVVRTLKEAHSEIPQIEGFTDLREIGRGGMGVVYRGRSTGLIERPVAIKRIAGLQSERDRVRFDEECESLARLSHPHIATVYQSGVDDNRHPYVAMEWVDGAPITEYCDAEQLTVSQRIQLAIQVCDAISYAHERGILHRDIKPPNVLVTEQSGKPLVKVIDFGIASRLDTPGGQTASTSLGTPGYVSPELITSNGSLVPDTRSDVYSLGVLLYELVAGSRPFGDVDPSQAWAQITSQSPPSLYACVSRCGARGQEHIAAARGGSTGELSKSTRGDISLIAEKAAALNPADRYGSADALRRDLIAHTKHMPIAARDLTGTYVAGRFLRRHWPVAVTLGLFVLALAGGVIAASLQAQKANRQAELARSAKAESDRVSQFLVDVFRTADPQTTNPRSVNAADILSAGRDKAESELADNPRVLARVLRLVGNISANLGDLEEAQSLLEQSADIQRKNASVGDRPGKDLADTLFALGRVQSLRAKDSAAIATLEAARDMYSAVVPQDLPGIANVNNTLANLYWKRWDLERAAQLHRRTLSLRQELLGNRHLDVSVSMINLAAVLLTQSSHAPSQVEAQNLLEEALVIMREQLPEEHLWIKQAQANLALTLFRQGDSERGLDVLHSLLNEQVERLGETHQDVIPTLTNIGDHLLTSGRADEALVYFRRANAAAGAVWDERHPDFARTLSRLGGAHFRMGNLEDARQHYEKTRTIYANHYGVDHLQTMLSEQRLARLELAQGQYGEAEARLERARKFFAEQPESIVFRLLSVDRDRLALRLATQTDTTEFRDLIDRHLKADLHDWRHLYSAYLLSARAAYASNDIERLKEHVAALLRVEEGRQVPDHLKLERESLQAALSQRRGDLETMNSAVEAINSQLERAGSTIPFATRQSVQSLLATLRTRQP